MLQQALNSLITKQISEGRQIGVQVCVYYKGKRLLSNSYGKIGNNINDPIVDNGTLFLSFSVTKGIVAILLHQLVENKFLDYDTPISHYWPKFGHHNKEKITIKQILSHQAGLYRMPTNCKVDQYFDENFMLKYIEESSPTYEPGTSVGYSPILYGWIIIGLLRKLTDTCKDLNDLIDDYIIKPFSLQGDLFIGLPYNENVINRLAKINIKVPVPEKNLEMYLASPPEFWTQFNSNEIKYLPLLSMNGYFTARALAKIYGILANGGRDGDRQVISLSCIENLQKCQTIKNDIVIGMPARKSMGMQLGPSSVFGDNLDTFGHCGIGGSAAFADMNRCLGIAVLVNKMNFDYKNDPVAEICNLIRLHIDSNCCVCLKCINGDTGHDYVNDCICNRCISRGKVIQRLKMRHSCPSLSSQ